MISKFVIYAQQQAHVFPSEKAASSILHVDAAFTEKDCIVYLRPFFELWAEWDKSNGYYSI